MSEQSEQINELATALAKAQGKKDLVAEASLLKSISPFALPPGMQHSRVPPLERLLSRVRFGMSECWHWCGPQVPQGYGQISFKGKNTRAHRLSYEIFKGPIPVGLHVLHSCDNPACVNPDHLSVGTYSDNRRDCISKGRWRMKNKRLGFSHQSNTVTPAMLDRMRDLRRFGLSYSAIAEQISDVPMKVWHSLNRRFKDVN